CFFFQAEDGIRDWSVTGVQTCALPILFKDNREATYGTIYVSTSAQMRMLSQRIAKAAQTGLIGSPEAFKQLQQSRDEFIVALKRSEERRVGKEGRSRWWADH